MPGALYFKGVRAAVLTVSDSCFRETRVDESGPALCRFLKERGAEVAAVKIVPDSKRAIINQLNFFAKKLKVGLILSTGGTGLGPRDVTPEATRAVVDKEVPGLIELMRLEGLKSTRRASLSRAVTGVLVQTLIINLPGSPKGARESFEAIADLVPHALAMIRGEGHE